MLRFHSYTDAHAPYFDAINRQWITEMFVLEAIDEQVISDPATYVIAPGGHIWFAEHPDLGIVGTCALMKKSPGSSNLLRWAWSVLLED